MCDSHQDFCSGAWLQSKSGQFFSQMCDSTWTHSQNSFSFKESPPWSGKGGLFPSGVGKVDCSQGYGSCNLPATGDPTTGNNFLLGAFPIPLLKICWHVGHVGEQENHPKSGKQRYNPKHPLSLFFFYIPKNVTLRFQFFHGEGSWNGG